MSLAFAPQHVVHVAVAVIQDALKRILITRRPLHVPHGGLWEVPGGKLEPEETASDALKREVLEEVGLVVEDVKQLGEIRHTYPEKSVCLHVFQVTHYTGHAQCQDGQLDLRWVNQSALSAFEFPEANAKIMKLVESMTDPLSV